MRRKLPREETAEEVRVRLSEIVTEVTYFGDKLAAISDQFAEYDVPDEERADYHLGENPDYHTAPGGDNKNAEVTDSGGGDESTDDESGRVEVDFDPLSPDQLDEDDRQKDGSGADGDKDASGDASESSTTEVGDGSGVGEGDRDVSGDVIESSTTGAGDGSAEGDKDTGGNADGSSTTGLGNGSAGAEGAEGGSGDASKPGTNVEAHGGEDDSGEDSTFYLSDADVYAPLAELEARPTTEAEEDAGVAPRPPPPAPNATTTGAETEEQEEAVLSPAERAAQDAEWRKVLEGSAAVWRERVQPLIREVLMQGLPSEQPGYPQNVLRPALALKAVERIRNISSSAWEKRCAACCLDDYIYGVLVITKAVYIYIAVYIYTAFVIFLAIAQVQYLARLRGLH
jgi:hypothetical protein